MVEKLRRFKYPIAFVLIGGISVAVFFANLTSIAEWAVHKSLSSYQFDKISVTVNKLNPWNVHSEGLTLKSQEGNLSIAEANFIYSPVSLSAGKLNAISLTSLNWEGNPVQFAEKFAGESQDEEGSVFESLAEFLQSPPVQHLRIRTSGISAETDIGLMEGTINLEGDFHHELAQLRVDGNFSGFPWYADLTLIQEAMEIFLGSQITLPELSMLPEFLNELGNASIDTGLLLLSEVLMLERGEAKLRGTAKISEGGVKDTFFELDASDVALTVSGLSFDLPRVLVFTTPESEDSWELNIFTNLNWGENFSGQGVNVHLDYEEGELKVTGQAESLQAGGILPPLEINGLVIDEVKFVHDDYGAIVGVEAVDIHFSSIHFESGLFNLYDGKIEVEWLGEERFALRLSEAEASLPDMGINLSGISYEGIVSSSELPKLPDWQRLEVDELFFGEDLRVDDILVIARSETGESVEFSEVSCAMEDSSFELKPANLQIHPPSSENSLWRVEMLDGAFRTSDQEDLEVVNLRTNLEFASLDPLETNSAQSVQFDIHAGEQKFEGGFVRFVVLPTGEKIIHEGRIDVFGGELKLDEFSLEDDLKDLKIKVLVDQLVAQQIINCFEDLDAKMDGNFSGFVDLVNLRDLGWDFSGGSINVGSETPGKLMLNLDGMLTSDLSPESAEYRNMYLLEQALKDLTLSGLYVNFKVMEDGERVVEMNVRGKSTVEGKEITIEYRPRIVGGRDALLQKLNLAEFGL
jgi:hypothetical protein